MKKYFFLKLLYQKIFHQQPFTYNGHNLDEFFIEKERGKEGMTNDRATK